MPAKWRSVVRFMGGTPESEDHPAVRPPDPIETVEFVEVDPPQPAAPMSSLDLLGEQNETIRSQIGHIGTRLEELANLKQDFTSLHESIASIIIEHPQLQAHVVEKDELLKRERESVMRLDREQRSLTAETARLTEELARLTAQSETLAQTLKQREDEAQQVRSELRDREALAADLEKQLGAETDRSRVFADENQAFRAEVQEADRTIVRLERDLSEARDALNVLQNDYQNARDLLEDQSARLAALNRSYTEQEHQLEAARHWGADLEAKLEAEQATSKRLESERDTDRAQLRTTLASEEVKLEGLRSRVRVTENILEQAREQLRARGEQIKTSERALRDATLERQAAERKLQAVQQDLAREALLASDAEKARLLLSDRCDMLTKALAAKDNALVNADEKIDSLSRKIEQLTADSDGLRESLEHRIRKLSDELNSERSERALAQGALESARRTRADVERELFQMRKGLGEVRKLSEELNSDRSQRPSVNTPGDNVRLFKSPD